MSYVTCLNTKASNAVLVLMWSWVVNHAFEWLRSALSPGRHSQPLTNLLCIREEWDQASNMKLATYRALYGTQTCEDDVVCGLCVMHYQVPGTHTNHLTICIWYRTTRGLKLCHYHWLSYNKLAKPLAMRKCSFRHPSSWHLTQTRSHGQVLRGRFKAWIFIPDPQPSISWHNLRHGTGTLIREYARFAHTLVVSSKIIMKAIASSVVFLF